MELNSIFESITQTIKKFESGWYYQKFKDLDHKSIHFNPQKLFQEIDLNQIKRILIFKPDDLGDAICALPSIKLLRDCYPNTHFSLICQSKTAPIYEKVGLVDKIITVNPKKSWSRFARLPSESNNKNESYDLAIFLRTYPSFFKDFLKISAKYHLHYQDPRIQSKSKFQVPVALLNREHQIKQLFNLIKPLLKTKYDALQIKFPQFNWDDKDKQNWNEYISPQENPNYIICHPFAPWETRKYPIEHWEKIFKLIHEKYNIPIVVIGGKEDRLFDRDEGLIQLQGKLDLMQSAFFISKAQFFIGGLSGPMHIASALNIPAIGIYGGHTVLSEWAPLKNTIGFSSSPKCSPCQRRTCKRGDLICLTSLEPSRFINEAFDFIDSMKGNLDSQLVDLDVLPIAE